MVQTIGSIITQLAYYGVIFYLIYSVKEIILTFLTIRATLTDFFFPRTPEEITIDHVRRHGGMARIVREIPENVVEETPILDPAPEEVPTLH